MASEKTDAESGEGGGIDGEYKKPDAKAALKIFREEIAPKQAHMATIKGDLSDPYKRIKDDCHFPRKVLDFLIILNGMEEAKRDHFLLALSLGMSELQLFVPRDLVTMANDEDGANVIPIGEREADNLATLDDDDFEAGEDELAAQSSRPSTQKAKAEADAASEEKPAPGTGAAARKAMKAPPKSAVKGSTAAAVH